MSTKPKTAARTEAATSAPAISGAFPKPVLTTVLPRPGSEKTVSTKAPNPSAKAKSRAGSLANVRL
jgi:hypothetical protein